VYSVKIKPVLVFGTHGNLTIHFHQGSVGTYTLRPVYSDTTQLNSTDLLRADWLYAATGSVALPIAGDS